MKQELGGSHSAWAQQTTWSVSPAIPRPPHVALAVDPGVLTTMPKPGILLRQGLLSGGRALADTRSCPLPGHLYRGCQLTWTQSKSILFLLVRVQLDASNSKTEWEASVTVVSAARVVSDHL